MQCIEKSTWKSTRRRGRIMPTGRNRVSHAILFAAIFLMIAWGAAAADKELVFIAGWGGVGGDKLAEICANFTAQTGIKTTYEKSDDVEALIRTRIAGGNPPDVVLQTRPAVIGEFVKAGSLTRLDGPAGVFKAGELEAIYPASLLALSKVGGAQYGFPFKADTKSLVFYNPSRFKALGLTVPKTWDQMMAVADKAAKAGVAPFAISGEGWCLSDWFENILIRVTTPENYNKLHISHTVAWTDPSVKKALSLMARIFSTKGYVDGGNTGALAIQYGESVRKVFSTNPTALMMSEGGFAGNTAMQDINTDLKEGVTIDFFPFPSIDPKYGDPVMGGADFACLFHDSPEARKFIRYLATKEPGDILAKANCVIPSKLPSQSSYTSPMALKQMQQINAAKTFVFDGSDMAPSAFGGDFEMTKLQDLLAHPGEVDRIAGELEAFAKTAY
jgi:alpha-glucoside transport system substrate-binding protein